MSVPGASPLIGGRDDFEFIEVNLDVLPLEQGDSPERLGVVRIQVPEPNPDAIARKPVDICCAIDISKSMNKHATYEVEDAIASDGYNLLDLALHGVRVILASLKPEDRFSLVSFNDKAEVVFPLTYVTEEAREAGSRACGRLKPRFGTNIWHGLRTSMDSLREGSEAEGGNDRNRFVILLSDGRTGFTLRQGHGPALAEYYRTNDFRCHVSTIGLGYEVDSKLLTEIATVGAGTFVFIPTAPVLGTVFGNAVASILSTYVSDACLTVTADSGFAGEVADGLISSTDGQPENTVVVELGPLLFGQTRFVPFPINAPLPRGPFLKARLDFGTESIEAVGLSERSEYSLDVEIAKIRSALVQRSDQALMHAVQKRLVEAHGVMRELVETIEASPEAHDERIDAIKKDVVGRMTKSFDGLERFKRWGQHYVRAIRRAHALQQCTNKLDFSVQAYCGSLFGVLRTRGERLFLSLPPPTPSLPAYQKSTRPAQRAARRPQRRRRGARAASPPRAARAQPNRQPARVTRPPTPTMERYTTQGGGCFGGLSTVIVIKQDALGAEIGRVITPMTDVKAGDVVVTQNRGMGTVLCVVEMRLSSRENALVAISPSGPYLTPKHPIRIDGMWRIPKGLGSRVDAGFDGVVFNFVLDDPSKSLVVDGYECVTLGHGLEDEGARHAFYGTKAVTDELRQMDGWKYGRVQVASIRRDENGHVAGFVEGGVLCMVE